MSQRMIVTPEELDFDSPGRRDYWVMLEHDTLWAQHLIPLSVWVGRDAKPDKGLVAFGSTHGNEYEGPVAIKRLLAEVDPADVTGRIILVPVLNVEAFGTGTRDSDAADGVNLNRAFVDGAGTAPALAGITHRIACFVREYIWPRVHVVIDIHSGGLRHRFALCSSHHEIEDEAQAALIAETAAWFGTPVVMIYPNHTPGLLTSEAERLGKIAIGSEMGWGAAVNGEGVAYTMHGIRAAAIHHGQMRGSIEPIGHHRDGTQQRAKMVDSDCFVYSPFAGHYEEVLACGTSVKKGDLVGRVHDFQRIDEPPFDVRAQCDGIVVAQPWLSTVLQGQKVLCVGKPISRSAGRQYEESRSVVGTVVVAGGAR